MARVKISEYRAKKILIDAEYGGVQLRAGDIFTQKGDWVLKVDQGIKKRFKRGLVALDVNATQVTAYIKKWQKQGFSQFIAEPVFHHEKADERYISLERVRPGVQILYARDGGVDVEANSSAVVSVLVQNEKDIAAFCKSHELPLVAISSIYTSFLKAHGCFLEINPCVVAGDKLHILDAAMLVDSCGEFFAGALWSEKDVVKSVVKNAAEERVAVLAATTPAALKLNVLHPDGGLFFLLSGGGGSIVIVDEVASRGASKEIGNYGEYSGGPTQEETQLYSQEILKLLLASRAPKKALVIAGGIANFTDIKTTLAGVVLALAVVAPQLRKQQVKVFVRRGGPREREGLARLKEFLAEEKLLGSVYGSETMITQAAIDAIRYIQS